MVGDIKVERERLASLTESLSHGFSEAYSTVGSDTLPLAIFSAPDKMLEVLDIVNESLRNTLKKQLERMRTVEDFQDLRLAGAEVEATLGLMQLVPLLKINLRGLFGIRAELKEAIDATSTDNKQALTRLAKRLAERTLTKKGKEAVDVLTKAIEQSEGRASQEAKPDTKDKQPSGGPYK